LIRLEVQCSHPVVKGATSMAVISGSGTVSTNGQYHFGDRVLVTCQHGINDSNALSSSRNIIADIV
jgi:hypothetical protein